MRGRDFGSFEGKSKDTLKEYDEIFEKLSKEEKLTYKGFGMESHGEMVGRLFTLLREIAVAHRGETVLVVSHETVMRVLLIHLGIGDYSTIKFGAVDNASWIELVSDGIDFFIKEIKNIEIK